MVYTTQITKAGLKDHHAGGKNSVVVNFPLTPINQREWTPAPSLDPNMVLAIVLAAMHTGKSVEVDLDTGPDFIKSISLLA